VDLKAEYSA